MTRGSLRRAALTKTVDAGEWGVSFSGGRQLCVLANRHTSFKAARFAPSLRWSCWISAKDAASTSGSRGTSSCSDGDGFLAAALAGAVTGWSAVVAAAAAVASAAVAAAGRLAGAIS